MTEPLTSESEALLEWLHQLGVAPVQRRAVRDRLRDIEAAASQRGAERAATLTVEALADALTYAATTPSGMTVAPLVFAFRSPVVMEWAATVLAALGPVEQAPTFKCGFGVESCPGIEHQCQVPTAIATDADAPAVGDQSAHRGPAYE